jgi:hypothetical protein
MVTEETEVAKFIEGIKSLMATNPNMFIGEYTTAQYQKDGYIGKWTDTGLFLVPSIALSALKRFNIFTQIPTEGSLTDALDQAGYLLRQNGRKKYQLRMNGRQVSGWLLKDELFPSDDAVVDGKTTT